MNKSESGSWSHWFKNSDVKHVACPEAGWFEEWCNSKKSTTTLLMTDLWTELDEITKLKKNYFWSPHLKTTCSRGRIPTCRPGMTVPEQWGQELSPVSLSVAPPLPSVYRLDPASGPALALPPPVGCTDLLPEGQTYNKHEDTWTLRLVEIR